MRQFPDHPILPFWILNWLENIEECFFLPLGDYIDKPELQPT